MQIEVSNGEIADKLSILTLKKMHITDVQKLVNINKEFDLLLPIVQSFIDIQHPLYLQLLAINTKLWLIEDEIRTCEKQQIFDNTFVELARNVYITNDQRASIKKEINTLTNSNLSEEKSYQ